MHTMMAYAGSSGCVPLLTRSSRSRTKLSATPRAGFLAESASLELTQPGLRGDLGISESGSLKILIVIYSDTSCRVPCCHSPFTGACSSWTWTLQQAGGRGRQGGGPWSWARIRNASSSHQGATAKPPLAPSTSPREYSGFRK